MSEDDYSRKQEILRLQREISELEEGQYDPHEQSLDDDQEDDDDEVKRLQLEIQQLERDISATDDRLSRLSYSPEPSSRDSVDYSSYLKNPLKKTTSVRRKSPPPQSPVISSSSSSISTSPVNVNTTKSSLFGKSSKSSSAKKSSFFSSSKRGSAEDVFNRKTSQEYDANDQPIHDTTSSTSSSSGRKKGSTEEKFYRKTSQEYQDVDENRRSPNRNRSTTTSGSGNATRTVRSTTTAGSSRPMNSSVPASYSSSSSNRPASTDYRQHSKTVTGVVKTGKSSQQHYDQHHPSNETRARSTTSGHNSRKLVASANSSYARKTESASSSGRPTIIMKKSHSARKTIFTAPKSTLSRDSGNFVITAPPEDEEDGEYCGAYNF